MTRHEYIQGDLKAYCDGELSPWRRLTVRRHLSQCQTCREEIQAMQRLHEDLRAADGVSETLAPALRARILSQIADVPPLPTPRPTSRLLQYSFAASLAVSVCFVLLLVHTGVLSPARTPAPSQVQPMASVQPQDQRAAAPAPKPAPMGARHEAPHEPQPAVERQTASTPSPAPGPSVMRPVPHPSPSLAPLSVPAVERTADKPHSATGGVPQAEAMKSVAAPRSPVLPSPPLPETVPGAGATMSEAKPAPPAALAPALLAQKRAAPSAERFAASPAPPAASGALAVSAADNSARARVDHSEPAIVGQWPTISLPQGADAATLKKTSVEVDWQVDEHGRVSGIHAPSTGNSDIDDLVRKAIQNSHFSPALHDGTPVVGRMTHTFVIGP